MSSRNTRSISAPPNQSGFPAAQPNQSGFPSAPPIQPGLPLVPRQHDIAPDRERERDDEANQKLNERIANLEEIIKSLVANIPSQSSESSTPAMNSSSTSPVGPADVPQNFILPQLYESRSVPRKNYNTTSTSVSTMFKENKIHSNAKDSFVKISMVRGGLSTAGLRNLLDGHRKKPIAIPNVNLYGFSERSVQTKEITDEITGIIKTVEIMLEEDDIFYYDYDCGRLYQAVIEIFGSSLHFLVPKKSKITMSRGFTER